MIEPPYPADTRAKGWRFELDYERIEQSDTWSIAGPEVKPWLLMLWFTAWKQSPVASLPNDEQVIAAKVGMPPRLWDKHRGVLMRGWKQADDGRLYHETLSTRALEMMARRGSDADRKAKSRGVTPESRGTDGMSRVTPAGQTRDSGVTPAGQTRDSGVTHDGLHRESSTGTSSKEKEKNARKRALPPGFEISPRVVAWAAQNGYQHLDVHFDHFVSKARAKGYRYVDWDEGFMGAIRKDWAEINGRNVHPIGTRRAAV